MEPANQAQMCGRGLRIPRVGRSGGCRSDGAQGRGPAHRWRELRAVVSARRAVLHSKLACAVLGWRAAAEAGRGAGQSCRKSWPSPA